MTAQWRALILVAVVAAVGTFTAGQALSAGNVVSGGRLSTFVTPITANTIKPAACAGIALTNIIVGVNGTAAANLLLGTPGNDGMAAGNGADCVLGGGGNDTINCGQGIDVAIGGPGNDIFSANCETQVP